MTLWFAQWGRDYLSRTGRGTDKTYKHLFLIDARPQKWMGTCGGIWSKTYHIHNLQILRFRNKYLLRGKTKDITFWKVYIVWQLHCVPLATEPGISLIILPILRILRHLKRTCLTVEELWRHVLEVATICVQTGLNPARHILEIPCQYVRCHCLNFSGDTCFQGIYGSWFVLVNSPFQISP